MAIAAVLAGAAGALAAPSAASAASITIVSDGSTLAGVESGTIAGVEPADSTPFIDGNTTGVSFGNAVVGVFGTFTPVPPGSPAGAEVINIQPVSCCDRQSGFFEVTFTLPNNFGLASISGAANVDDQGYEFLNGHLIADSTEFGNATFESGDQTFFSSGVNTLFVSDDNSGGGPSGAAFYATVSYGTPEPSTWVMMLLGFAGLGFAGYRSSHKRAALSV